MSHTSPQRKVLPILFGTLLLDMVGTGMIIPIIPVIFTDAASPSFLLHGYTQGMQFVVAGLVTAIFGLMQFLASPILGELSDVYGRKRLLTIGVGVLALSQVFFGFGIEIASVGLILFARAIAGIAAGNFSIAQAAVSDVTEPKDRAKNFGLIGAAYGVGFILGPLLGGWIAGVAHSAAAPFWFAGALGILNLIFVTTLLPETNKHPRSVKHFTFLKGIHNIQSAFRDVDARPIYAASFLYACGFAFMTSFMGILLVNRFGFDEVAVGTFFGVIGVWIVVTQIFILRVLTAKYSERVILRYSLLCLAGAMAVYPFFPSSAWLFITMPFIAVPQGLSMANMTALVSKGVSSEKQGAALGINGSLLALSQGIIPLAAGIGSGFVGIRAPFVAGALFIVAAWSILFVVQTRRTH